MRKNPAACIGFIFYCIVTQASYAQEAGTTPPYVTGNPDTWPSELDAVVAAPGNHKVLIETDFVRVLQVTVMPGAKEPLHSHQWPSSLYVQTGSDFIDRDGGGNVIFDSRNQNEPMKLPFVTWKEPEAPHRVVNRSETEIARLIRMEIKKK